MPRRLASSARERRPLGAGGIETQWEVLWNLEKFVRWKSKKNSEENSENKRCYANTLRPRSIRSDALYPALSGEWEVPVTRNAKITPVNGGVGGGGWGAGSGGLPSGITFGRVPRYP